MADSTPIDSLADQIFAALKGYVDSRLCELASVADVAGRAQSAADGVASSIEALKSVAETLKPGRDGIDGKSVDMAEVRALVHEAVRALPEPVIGKDGDKGDRGPKGEDGRDALQIEVLDALDEAKSYPRGTYSKHGGGLVRAYRDTDPIQGAEVERCGWQVLINPVVDVCIKQDEANPKRLTFISTKAFGKPSEGVIDIPVMVYRGVYREGDVYGEGDVSTWGGSLWHCKAKETTEKPGLGGDWVLAVKRGRDGRDGKDGINGKDGKVIRV